MNLPQQPQQYNLQQEQNQQHQHRLNQDGDAAYDSNRSFRSPSLKLESGSGPLFRIRGWQLVVIFLLYGTNGSNPRAICPARGQDGRRRPRPGGLLTVMTKGLPSIDLTHFPILLKATDVPQEDDEYVLPTIPIVNPKLHIVVAYDLDDGAVVANSYLNPEPRPSTPHGSYDASIEAARCYMDSRDVQPQTFLLLHDYVDDLPQSRLKVYMFALLAKPAGALDLYSMGGRMTGPVIARYISNTSGSLICFLTCGTPAYLLLP
ncbi:hypothetical protein PG984_013894 [Apiospora sp. TS-2023a]